MRTYTWDEYYEKFYDWAESTQVRNLSALTSLGSADEVGEIIIELQVNVPTSMILSRNHPLRKGDSLVLLLLFLQEQVPECLRLKEDGIIEDATATAPTVRLTMVTDTVDGIMDMTMITAANLAVIKAAAVWIKEMKNSHFYDRVGV